jgi:hypothetical protein
VDHYVGGLSKPCHRCVTDMCKRLMCWAIVETSKFCLMLMSPLFYMYSLFSDSKFKYLVGLKPTFFLCELKLAKNCFMWICGHANSVL